MAAILSDLAKFEGKNIKDICGCAYHNDAENHCAHFVSHAMGYKFGFTCKNMTGKGDSPANIRVHEVFVKCPVVGLWADRPADLQSCLAFVTARSNVNLNAKQMQNVPKKHIGVFAGGQIWHYANLKDRVVKQSPELFAKHYSGDDIAVFYGTFPI